MTNPGVAHPKRLEQLFETTVRGAEPFAGVLAGPDMRVGVPARLGLTARDEAEHQRAVDRILAAQVAGPGY